MIFWMDLLKMTSDKIINRCTSFQTKPFCLILYSGLKRIISWLLMTFNDDEVSRESEKSGSKLSTDLYIKTYQNLSRMYHLKSFIFFLFLVFNNLEQDFNSKNIRRWFLKMIILHHLHDQPLKKRPEKRSESDQMIRI